MPAERSNPDSAAKPDPLAHVPAHTRAGLVAMNADRPLAKVEDKAEFAQSVLARYEQGERMEDIALGLGLRGADQLYRLLLSYAPEEWRAYQAARAVRRMEQAHEELRTAPDGLALTRARETARFASWEMERLIRRLYGQEQVTSAGVPIQINIGIVQGGEPPHGDGNKS